MTAFAAARPWLVTRRRALGRVAALVMLGALPVAINALVARNGLVHGNFAFDFHNAFWSGGQAILAGESPYPPAIDAVLATQREFVYPPIAAVLMAPLALLPHSAGDIVATVLVALCAAGTLRVLGVRDWRCYGAMFLAYPTVNAIHNASVSTAIALAVAIAWRYRERARVVGVALGLAVATKIFVWPLLIWLAVARRAAAAWTLAVAGALSLAGWLVVGFGQVGAFADALGGVRRLEEAQVYTPFALAARSGVPSPTAHALAAACGVLALAATLTLARRPDREWAAFCAGLAASLLLSPIVWAHYFVLLFVPLAVARPRFGPLWLLPVASWLVAAPAMPHEAWHVAAYLAGAGALLVVAAGWKPRLRGRARTRAPRRLGELPAAP